MGSKAFMGICGALLVVAMGVSGARAANKNAEPVPLSENARKLQARYTAMLKELQAQIAASLPSIDAPARAAFLESLQAVKKAQAKAEAARKNPAKLKEPQLKQELAAAAEAIARAQAQTLQALEALGLVPFLSSDKLDDQLAKFVVLHEATPTGLAEFAGQNDQQAALVDQLLSDAGLMRRMVMADGAAEGKYGRAMAIYAAIQKANPKAGDGVLEQLALAIALEHAVPIKQANPKDRTDAPATVDPLKRYQHFEKAFLDGELDPAFKSLDAWDLRMVVNGDEPDETLAWGRQMLRNYRPDIVANPDYRWRYVDAVRTEVRYGSEDVQYDRPDLQPYQNMIMNGGVCGRRAFFGRFILRAFGIPTTARPQTGHASLVHWTPEGWVVNLGAGWGHGWTRTRYRSDLDFLATTQARRNMTTYLQVKRAQWIGDAAGEKPVFGLRSGDPGFWYAVSLYRQQQLIQESKAIALAAAGENIGQADGPAEKPAVKAPGSAEADRKIVVGNDGTITIPAVACSKPTSSTAKIRFMSSNLGGMQLHYSRLGGAENFEYTFDAPAAGQYTLTARVVTTSDNQHLRVVANGAGEPADIAVPFTVGMWDTTPPVQVTLLEGRNVLTFSHRATGQPKGVTIRDFTLKPVAASSTKSGRTVEQ